MNFLLDLKKRAKQIDANIVLPEANLDERVYSACKYILKNKLSRITVFGKKTDFDEDFNTDFCTIIDLKATSRVDRYAKMLYELRKDKLTSLDEAKALVKQANYFACMLVVDGKADGVVMGAKYTTKDAIKPALQIIKSKGKVSGLMTLYNDKKQFVLSDVSLQVAPNAEDLADIANNAANFMDNVVGIKPVVAMLSYSTLGSGAGVSVDSVREATEMAKKKMKYDVIGEIQADAALNFQIGKKKGVESRLAGKSNVLVFPDINSGNIGYKLLTNLGGFKAIGPIMVGLNKPVNDLSRGCTVQEIVNTVLVTKLQTK